MSMLAERRTKQKIGPDPNNKRWKNDKEKFGHKMLEKFGWSDGSGLGANLQGDADNIQLKANRSQKGLGAKGVSDDNWLGHQDCFDEILASLNTDHAQTTMKTADDDAAGSDVTTAVDRRSLEQQCTKIRYLKFARGKDLNSKDADAVHEVLGKRSKRRRRDEDGDKSETKMTKTTVVDDDDEDVKVKESPNMTTSAVTVNDYYKNKMAAKLAKLKKRDQ